MPTRKRIRPKKRAATRRKKSADSISFGSRVDYPEHRVFNGKRYVKYHGSSDRDYADRLAATVRERGGLARVVPIGVRGYYIVYTRNFSR